MCGIALLCITGCGSNDRYFAGEAKVTSPQTNAPGSNAWVAMSVRVAADGTATVKYGPMGAVVQGAGTFNDGAFSAQIPSDGVGPITAQGKQTTEPGDKGETLVGITGTLTRNAGESGEFTVVEIEDGKKFYELYEVS